MGIVNVILIVLASFLRSQTQATFFERLLCKVGWRENREEKVAICIFPQGKNVNKVTHTQTLVASLVLLKLFTIPNFCV